MSENDRSSGGNKKILMTGFEAFGEESVNPASQLAQEFDGVEKNGYEVIGKKIPTVYGESSEKVEELIEEYEPDIVLHVGLANGTHGIRVERVALNMEDARIEDNAGNEPTDEKIEEKGPLAYRTTLSDREIVEAVKDEGIPSYLSYSAGTYVCNHVIYSTAHYVETNDLDIDYVFIHIPLLPEQAVDKKENPPSMGIETMKRAFETVIETITEDS